MKRYQLLKDLPTFNKGETFRIDVFGNLVRENDGVVAYARKTLEGFKILEGDWFKEVSDKRERWRSMYSGAYWYIRELGDVEIGADFRDSASDTYYELGNYFKTKEDAEKMVDWLKAFATLRDDAGDFAPDWGKTEQMKWYAFYDHEFNIISTDYSYCGSQDSIIYFATEEKLEASIREHKQEWLTFFGVDR